MPMIEATPRAGHHLRTPPVPHGLLTRPRVLRALDDTAPASVVCLQAPGGYGKTTALAEWVARDPRHTLWLGVRPAAADAHWVAQALLEALHDDALAPGPVHLPGQVDTVSWHLSTLPVVERVVSSVAEPVILVVDDAGALSGTPWDCLVESLAVSLPEGSTLVLTTREAVPSTLWRLHARGLVRVIGPEVLAFDRHEAERMMELLGVRMPPEELEEVLRTTEGWPVAVYLRGLSVRSRSPADAPASATGISGLDEYLRADVVGRMAGEDRAFLERVSVLSTLDPVACDAITGTSDSGARLRRLASENHLLAPQDTSSGRLRMHPLLAQLLGDDLRERDPEAWREAHRAASLVEEQRGDVDGAVHHAKLARDDERLADLVWSHTAEQLGHGRWAVVQRWLGGLDGGRVNAHCRLALSAAHVAIQAGDSTAANRLVLEASRRADDGDSSCRPHVDLLEATIGAGGLERIEAATRGFIGSTPSDDPWQTLAYFLLGTSLVLRDRTDDGVWALDEGRRRAEALDIPIVHALCLAGLADVAIASDAHHRALGHVRQLREIASTFRLDTVAAAAPVFTTSTMGYVLEGRFVDARRESVRALRLIALMRSVAPWHAVLGRLTLARVNLVLGDPDRAKVLLDEASEARGPATASPALDRIHAETERRLSRVTTTLAGASTLTTAEVRVLQFLPTHLSFPQIAEELVVSRHTVKTQAMSAYRKLGVHTRTDAIDRARRAGLLPGA